MTQAPAPPAHTRLPELDGLRGIAALVVMLYHYGYYFFELYGHPEEEWVVLQVGQHGVEVFFMLSGFVILFSLQRITRPADFVVSRVARLYPVYWLSILITSLIVHLTGLPAAKGLTREVGLADTLINLTMFQDFVGVNRVDGSYWTLTLELSFYILCGTAMFTGLLKKPHRTLPLAVGCLFLITALEQGAGVHVPYKIRTLFLFDYGGFFLLGMLLFLYWRGTRGRWIWLTMTAAVLLLWMQSVIHGSMALMALPLFFLILHQKLPVLASTPLIFLGSISYSLYIVHQYNGYAFLLKWEQAGLPIHAGQLVAMILAILLATAMTYGVERPAAKWIRKHWSRHRERSPSTSA